MDPNATVLRIKRALDEGDPIEARFALQDLQAWMTRDGFPPDHEHVAILLECVLRSEWDQEAGESDFSDGF